MAELALPRDVALLEGHEGPERAFLDALERGRLHHAWLLVGPEGVGKATFAYRAARRLLGARPEPAYGVLGADPEDPVFRQVAGRAHPDLMVLERDDPDAKARKSIPVDEARALPEFFSKSPGRAAYRVAIIDTADDLNPNAANAVLKTLEEPPERGVLFLISHRPGALLPTIRSRCRRLAFSPPPAELVAPWVAAQGDMSLEDALRCLAMARGGPGRALRLAASKALDIDDAARELVDRLPAVDRSAAQALADGFRGAEGAQRFALLMDRIAAALHARAAAGVLDGRGRFDRDAEAWSLVSDLPGEVEGINLDRADAFFTALGRLAALA
ncbi:MAG TPA: DNA polymerase III subunit delta' [Caulobacteraceae bacterium]|jgi:DNA polymerase-3 subunit delta'|nr:DNA polymerase III subunit delta' [Caulobacteraceae bacterium]